MEFIFVHGTWGKDSSWIKEDSFLSKALKKKYNCNIDNYTWEHNNDQNDRNDAAKKLANFLADRSDENILICHSHGGNVALDSLRYNIKNVKAVITLSTPFILTIRKNSRLILSNLILSIMIVSFTMIIGFEMFRQQFYPYQNYIPFLLIALISLGAIIGVKSDKNKLLNILTTKVEKKMSDKELDDYISNEVPILSLFTENDEAIFALQFAENLAHLPYFLMHKWFKIIILLFALFVFAITKDQITLLLIPFFVIAVPPMFSILSIFISSLFNKLFLGINILNYDNFFCRVIVTMFPYGFKNYETISLFLNTTNLFSLSHSKIYNEQVTVEVISSWLDKNAMIPKD